MSTSNIKFLTQHVNTTYKHDYKSKYIPIVINIINAMTKSNIKFIPIQNKSVIVNMCVLFYLSFGCISAYANVYFQPTIIKQNIKIILLQNNIHMFEELQYTLKYMNKYIHKQKFINEIPIP